MTEFRWTGQREQAAYYVALDTKTNDQIATLVGLSVSGLKKWMAHPDFQARVAAIRAEMRAALVARGVALRQARLDELQSLLDAMRVVRTERAADMVGIPGGASGLLVRQFKQVGKDDYREEYPFDAALVREMRAVLQQAAQEVGEWTTRLKVDTGDLDAEIERELARLAAGREGATAGAAEGT